MYIEASSPRRQGDKAKLQVSVSGNGAPACLRFYYHMYGDSMGSLNVFSGNSKLFIASGNQGNMWKKFTQTIYLRNNVSVIIVQIYIYIYIYFFFFFRVDIFFPCRCFSLLTDTLICGFRAYYTRTSSTDEQTKR